MERHRRFEHARNSERRGAAEARAMTQIFRARRTRNLRDELDRGQARKGERPETAYTEKRKPDGNDPRQRRQRRKYTNSRADECFRPTCRLSSHAVGGEVGTT